MGRIGQDWVDNKMNEEYGGQVRLISEVDVIGEGYGRGYGYGYNNEIWVLGEGNDVRRGMDIVGGGGCVLVVGDKIEQTCVWARKENWKYM